jgi:hypothetical protein
MCPEVDVVGRDVVASVGRRCDGPRTRGVKVRQKLSSKLGITLYVSLYSGAVASECVCVRTDDDWLMIEENADAGMNHDGAVDIGGVWRRRREKAPDPCHQRVDLVVRRHGDAWCDSMEPSYSQRPCLVLCEF